MFPRNQGMQVGFSNNQQRGAGYNQNQGSELFSSNMVPIPNNFQPEPFGSNNNRVAGPFDSNKQGVVLFANGNRPAGLSGGNGQGVSLFGTKKCNPHQEKDFEAFCRTCRKKICWKCHQANQGDHRTHDIVKIEDLESGIQQREVEYELGFANIQELREKCMNYLSQIIKVSFEKIQREKRHHCLGNLKSLLLRDFEKTQRDFINQTVKNAFLSDHEFNHRIYNYNHKTDKCLSMFMDETPDAISARFNENARQKCYNQITTAIDQNQQMIANVFENANKNILELQCCISVEIDRDRRHLKVIRKDIRKDLRVNLDELNEICSVSFIFEKPKYGIFDSYDQDNFLNRIETRILEMIFRSLPSLNSVGVYYKSLPLARNLKDQTKLFSLILFEESSLYKSITLSFVDSHGAQQYFEALEQFLRSKTLGELSVLNSLTLEFNGSGTDSQMLNEFQNKVGVYLKEIKKLSITLDDTLGKEADEFLKNLLYRMIKLETCNINMKETQAGQSQSNTEMSFLSALETSKGSLKTLNLTMPSLMISNSTKKYFINVQTSKVAAKNHSNPFF